jgi:predicted nucleotidyltransferase
MYTGYLARAEAVAARFARLPQVRAVALAGSLVADLADEHSDLDLYIYADTPIDPDVRRVIAAEFAGQNDASVEIDKPFWGSEDAWIDHVSGLGVDLIYWSPAWIEEQISRTLDKYQAWMGYTTSFWYTVLHSQAVYDRDGWFANLKQRVEQPYPAPLRDAIVALNYPVLRRIGSSYRHQIELAILRRDRISVHHRVTALLASYFDIVFAVNCVPHPGEKRLVVQAERLCSTLPDNMAEQIERLLIGLGAEWSAQHTLDHVDALLDALDAFVAEAGMTEAAQSLTLR